MSGAEARPEGKAPDGRDGRPVELAIRVGKLAWWVLILCVGCEVLFVLLDYHVNYGRGIDVSSIRRFFNTAREDALPSWFATTQTLMVALTLWVTYLLVKRRPGSRWRGRGFLVVAIFFSYMAVDDGAQVHERFAGAIRHLVERMGISLDAFPSYSWQLIFLPGFAALGLFALGFLWQELGRGAPRLLLLSAFALLGVAVGMDFLEGLDEGHSWNVYASLAERPEIQAWSERRFERGAFETLVHFSKSLEETLEMFAHSLLWFVFLRHLGRVASDVRIRLS